MIKYLVLFCFLCSLALGAELLTGSEPKPSYPVFLLFSPDGEVLLVIHLTPYTQGDWDKPWFDYECKIFRFNQWSFLEFLGANWLSGGFTLNTFNTLSPNPHRFCCWA